MTREEAIDFAEFLKNNWIINFAEMEEFCDMAIEALQAIDEQLYVFAVPDAMIDHKFNDDVAITWAISKAEAIEKFSRLYKDVKHEEVDAVLFNHFGVAILTDY